MELKSVQNHCWWYIMRFSQLDIFKRVRMYYIIIYLAFWFIFYTHTNLYTYIVYSSTTIIVLFHMRTLYIWTRPYRSCQMKIQISHEAMGTHTYAINSFSLKLEFVYYAIVHSRLPHFRTKSVQNEYTAGRFTWAYWVLYFNLGH